MSDNSDNGKENPNSQEIFDQSEIEEIMDCSEENIEEPVESDQVSSVPFENSVDSETSFESVEHENSVVSDQGEKYVNNKNNIGSETSFEYMDQEEKGNDFINKNEENLESQSRKCMICSEMINCQGRSTLGQINFSKHVKSCRLYFRFFKKILTNLQCLLCPFKIHDINRSDRTRSEMYDHLRQTHSNKMFAHIREKLSNEVTGKSFSEALILASTDSQYDKRMFIELQVQYMKIAFSEHVENMLRTC